MNRRKLFKIAAGASGALIASTSRASDVCDAVVPTVTQVEGPFYPADWKDYEADADMTQVDGGGFAMGQVVLLKGLVQDLDCNPIDGAVVDIWQASIFGQYFHENDAEFEDLKDKNFQYRCRVITNEKGEFSVKTIKPAAYPAGGSWVRPPHIHYKVNADGFKELITQMYFRGDSLNSKDRILNDMTQVQRDGVIVDFKEDGQKILTGIFKVVLEEETEKE